MPQHAPSKQTLTLNVDETVQREPVEEERQGQRMDQGRARDEDRGYQPGQTVIQSPAQPVTSREKAPADTLSFSRRGRRQCQAQILVTTPAGMN